MREFMPLAISALYLYSLCRVILCGGIDNCMLKAILVKGGTDMLVPPVSVIVALYVKE